METRLKVELAVALLLLVLTGAVGVIGWKVGKDGAATEEHRVVIHELTVTNRTLERTIQQIEVTNRIMLGIISNQDARIQKAGAITNAGSLEEALEVFRAK